MIYGIMYHRGRGKHAFMMRQHEKFKSLEEERLLTPQIVTILEEETGDGFLLAEKIAAYAREHHLELEFPIDLTSVQRAAMLSDAERIEMLTTSVRVLAEKLEDARRRAWELEYAHWHVSQEHESTSYLVDELKAVIGVAQGELHCNHLPTALERHEAWKRDNLQ